MRATAPRAHRNQGVGVRLVARQRTVARVVLIAQQHELIGDQRLAHFQLELFLGKQLVEGIRKIGIFKLQVSDSLMPDNDISSQMHSKDALVALVIPAGFTSFIQNKADEIATRSLKDPDSLQTNSQPPKELADSLLMYYHPVMQTSFRQSVEGALRSSVQVIQKEAIVKKLYEAVNQKEIPQDLEKQRRTYLTATMKWDRNGTTVRVVPPFVAANLAGSRESKLPRAAFWNSRAVALGMDDFCRVRWKRETFFFVLLENHPKNAVEFFQRLLTGGHQRVTTGNGGNFGNPGAVFLPVKNDLVVFETHFVSQLLN